jgi:hypothetical protein
MILDRAASEPPQLDNTALTHTLWAVGVKGTTMDGNSGSFQTLLAESAQRAAKKKISRTGAAGVIWACGRLQVCGGLDILWIPSFLRRFFFQCQKHCNQTFVDQKKTFTGG